MLSSISIKEYLGKEHDLQFKSDSNYAYKVLQKEPLIHITVIVNILYLRVILNNNGDIEVIFRVIKTTDDIDEIMNEIKRKIVFSE